MSMLKQVAMASTKVEMVKAAEEIPEEWDVVRGDDWAVSMNPTVFDDLDESAVDDFKESLTNLMDTLVGKKTDDSCCQ